MSLAIAPMIECTDRHYRYFMRQITRHTTLYSEMLTTGALLYGNRDHLLNFDPVEKPLVLQLGGSDPDQLAACARIAEARGYSGINLNVGCPSDRVQRGCFGLALMKTPEQVAACVRAMKAATSLPVSVKCRTGVDHHDSQHELEYFISCQIRAGVDHLCIHARKGWLKGLSPRENRNVPPLEHERVHALKSTFPGLCLGINGGITLTGAPAHLQKVDYVMIGREAYHNPYHLAQADQLIYEDTSPRKSRVEVAEAMLEYIESCLQQGIRLNHITRHILGLFHGQPRGRRWRQHLSTAANRKGAGTEIVAEALDMVRDRERHYATASG